MNTQLSPNIAKVKAKSQLRLKWNQFWREIRRDSFLYLFLAPFLICFLLFIVIPVIMAATLGFTSYDGFGSLHFIGIDNYISLFTQDIIFLTKAIPNTFYSRLSLGQAVIFFLFYSHG